MSPDRRTGIIDGRGDRAGGLARGAQRRSRLSPPTAVYYNRTVLNLYRRGQSYTRAQVLEWA